MENILKKCIIDKRLNRGFKMSSQIFPKAQVVTAVLMLIVSVSLYLWPSEQSENTISKDLSQVSGGKLPLFEKQNNQSFFKEQTKTNEEKLTEEVLSQKNIVSEKTILTNETESPTVEIKEESEEEINEEIKTEEIKNNKSILTSLLALNGLGSPFGGKIEEIISCKNFPGDYIKLSEPTAGNYVYQDGVSYSYIFGSPAYMGQWLLGMAGGDIVCCTERAKRCRGKITGKLIIYHGSSPF